MGKVRDKEHNRNFCCGHVIADVLYHMLCQKVLTTGLQTFALPLSKDDLGILEGRFYN